ncbi:MAG: hypothetical protein AB8H47_13425 [Bacteroidia bacterium]
MSKQGDLRQIATVVATEASKIPNQAKVKLSRNKQRILLYTYRRGRSLKSGGLEVDMPPTDMLVFDTKLSLSWSDKFPDQAKGYRFQKSTLEISDEGKVVFSHRNAKSQGMGTGRIDIQLYVYDEGQKNHQFSIQTEKRLSLLKTSFQPNGNLYCAAFYKDDGYKFAGSFYQKFDLRTGTAAVAVFSPLSPEMQSKLYPSKFSDIYGFSGGEIILQSDGSLILALQRLIISAQKSPDGSISNYLYTYSDIFMTGIGADGKVLWTDRIEMAPFTSGRIYLYRFNLVVLEDKIGFIRTFADKDNAPNLKEKFREFNGPPVNCGIDFVSYDPQGNKQIEMIMPNDGKGHAISFSFEAIQDKNTIVFYARQKSSYHFMKLEF